MWIRMRLDIGWCDLASGIAACFLPGRRSNALQQACNSWDGKEEILITLSVRSAFDSNLLVQLRKQPSTPLLRLLTRRWQTYDFRRIERRIRMGKRLDWQLGRPHKSNHSYWIYPLIVEDPRVLRDRLRMAGFDATSLARMFVIPAVDEYRIPTNARRAWEHFVVLPWYPEIPDDSIDSMYAVIDSLEANTWALP